MRIAHCPQCGGNVQVTSSGTCPLGHPLPESAEGSAQTGSSPSAAASGPSLFGLGSARAAKPEPAAVAVPKKRASLPTAGVVVAVILAVLIGAGGFFGYQMLKPNPEKVVAKAAATTSSITSSTYTIKMTITGASKKPAIFSGAGSSTPEGTSVSGRLRVGKKSMQLDERIVGKKLYVRTDPDVGWVVLPASLPERSIADGKLAPVDYLSYLKALSKDAQPAGVEVVDGVKCVKVSLEPKMSALVKQDSKASKKGAVAKAVKSLESADVRLDIWVDQQNGRPVKELIVITTKGKPAVVARTEIEFTGFNSAAAVVAPPKAELASTIAKKSAEKRAAAARLAKRLRVAKSKSATERQAQETELSRQDQLVADYASQGVKASKTKQDGMQQLMWNDGTTVWVDSSTMPGDDIYGTPY